MMFKIEVIEHVRGKGVTYTGHVIESDHCILQTPEYLQERTARREIRNMLRQSLFHCHHDYEDEGEISVDNAWGGIDYIHTSTCKKCGLSDVTVGDRSIYDDEDD